MGAATCRQRCRRAVLRLPRPAESAARRLVIALARGLAPAPQALKASSIFAYHSRSKAFLHKTLNECRRRVLSRNVRTKPALQNVYPTATPNS
jgi:hypothetical protein